MDLELMKKIGFSEQEIKIYLALLRIGPSTASRVASEAGIDRATTYRFLDSLIGKGAVSYFVTNNVKRFSAAHPSRLVEDLREKTKQMELIVPELEGLILQSGEETRVELYKGKEGLKSIMKDILRDRKEYTFIGEVEKFFTELAFYIDQWLRQVEKIHLKGRLICAQGSKFRVAKTENYKLISKEFISKISTWTYGNKTALFVWSDPPYGIVIENKDVKNSNLDLYNALWKIAKMPNPCQKKNKEKPENV
ncbi:MAG: helix-turn-helix domain-containing protein [Nanoarchaeota archaeon]